MWEGLLTAYCDVTRWSIHSRFVFSPLPPPISWDLVSGRVFVLMFYVYIQSVGPSASLRDTIELPCRYDLVQVSGFVWLARLVIRATRSSRDLVSCSSMLKAQEVSAECMMRMIFFFGFSVANLDMRSISSRSVVGWEVHA